jgi:hypothetical protein
MLLLLKPLNYSLLLRELARDYVGKRADLGRDEPVAWIYRVGTPWLRLEVLQDRQELA